MAQMTETRYRKLKNELISEKKALEDAIQAQAQARELNDLSENAEYETARRASEMHNHRISEIEDELNNAEIVESDNSPRIIIGSVLDICQVDGDGQAITQPRRLVLDAKGSTVLNNVLGIKSPLGAAVFNGTDGIYHLPNNGGVSFLVRKVHT